MDSLVKSGLEVFVDGLRNALYVLGKVNPKIHRLKAEDLTDGRILRKLEREGFFK